MLASRRADMRGSQVWRRCLATLQALTLLSGHVRPVAKAAVWMQQSPVMPGDPAASAAAKAADVAGNFAEAFKMPHPKSSMQSSLPPDVEAAIRWQCDIQRGGGSVADQRDRRFSAICSCATDLEGWSTDLGRLSPEWVVNSVPPRPHYALFDCCMEACGLPDSQLVSDLVCGAPAVGSCPDSGRFKADWQPAAVCMDDLDHAGWHSAIERQLRESGGDPARSEEHAALWARTQKEVTDGWATPIGDLSAAETFFGGPQSFRAMVRFGVWQCGRLRPCDNGRSSLHNLATELFERLTVESADFPARAAALYAELMGDSVSFAFSLGTEDVQAAYRRMACSEPWFTVFAQWDPTTSSVVYFRLQGFNFGLKSAVVAFNRLSNAMWSIVVRLCGVCCAAYFDDFCCAEPSFSRGGQQMLRDVAARLRVPFSGDYLGQPLSKSVAPKARNAFLGVTHDFSRFARLRESTASVDAGVLEELASDISASLAEVSFRAAGGLLKLVGRLQFTLSWAMGRFGRAALNPLHAAGSGGRSEFSPELRGALEFLRDLLVDPLTGKARLKPRKFSYKRSREPTVLVWSDACWEASAERPAGIGFVVFFPASAKAARQARAAASGPSPPWLNGASTPPGVWRFAAYAPAPSEYAHWRVRKQYIGQLELLAAVAVYYSLAAELRGREVIHFIDNSGAMACLIKDYSSDVDSARLVHAFWGLACALEIDVWFEFVYSEANVADWPSRGWLSFATELGAVVVKPLRLPQSDAWAFAESVPDRPAKRARHS